MKTLKRILACAGIITVSLACNSCLNDDNAYSLDKVWYSMATVVPLEDTPAYYLRLDGGETLWPAASAIPWYVPGEQHRALALYTLLSDTYYGFDHAAKVHDLRDVLTKPVAEDRGEENDAHYGNDPVKIKDLWIGDGYLNVIFGFNYGGSVKHFINLVKRDGTDTPDVLEFRHNAYQDPAHVWSTGIVSFDLSSLATDGEERKLTVRVKTFDGDRDYEVTWQPAGGEEEKPGTELPADGFAEVI
ncbi:MAG: NigD-like protein [Tannerella sp.]|jgi:hypothetical protein|nr:NigD-like protein [Tannerella sp.]